MIRVAINGFGRIGRSFMRVAVGDPDIEVVAINDLASLENLSYLLRYDSVYGAAPFAVDLKGGVLSVAGTEVSFLQEKDPHALPWKNMGIDVVVESTGFFTSFEKARAHLEAGAKRVVISAPVEDELPGGATVLMGINEEKLVTSTITSNASCTTNAVAPVIAILDESLGIEKALLNTTHAYTSSQSIVDSPVHGSDFRRGRAGAHSMAPSSTGAATAVTKAYSNLSGKFDGISVRVPVIAGSLADLTCLVRKATTTEEVNSILERASKETRWEGLFSVTYDQLVSSDIIGNPHASIADLSMTRVVGGTLVKVLSWYDNEMGYTHTLVQHVLAVASYLLPEEEGRQMRIRNGIWGGGLDGK